MYSTCYQYNVIQDILLVYIISIYIQVDQIWQLKPDLFVAQQEQEIGCCCIDIQQYSTNNIEIYGIIGIDQKLIDKWSCEN